MIGFLTIVAAIALVGAAGFSIWVIWREMTRSRDALKAIEERPRRSEDGKPAA
jgi:hypothetical protein